MNDANKMLPELSLEFIRRVTNTFGIIGEAWLQDLPSLLVETSAIWCLKILPAVYDMSYNYVAPVICADGSEAVLKAGVPNRELVTEIETLRMFAGQGAVRLLKANADKGLLLLECLKPGRTLYSLNNDMEATEIACHVMGRLHHIKGDSLFLPAVNDWIQRGFGRLRKHFEGGTGPFPKPLVEKAERISCDLLGSMAKPVLLHGDLHHWNILSSERQDWLAIDPKGVIGEPEYETGAWLRNPYPQLLNEPHQKTILFRRVAQFSDILGFDPERILNWGFVQVVLSAWWSYEDGDKDWRVSLGLAEVFPS